MWRSPRQAVILVGGLGTRLGDLTLRVPKPLLPCGDRPFLAWLLLDLCRHGIEEVLLLTGYRSEMFVAALPSLRAELPASLRLVCHRENGQAGTGGALVQARDHLDTQFLLCNGDSWLDFDVERVLADAVDDPDNASRMVLCHLQDASRYGVAETQGGRVVGFQDRPQAGYANTINAGIYWFKHSGLADASPIGSLERDILPRLAQQDRLRASVVDASYFIDIGIPVDFARAQTEIPARILARSRSGGRHAG